MGKGQCRKTKLWGRWEKTEEKEAAKEGKEGERENASPKNRRKNEQRWRTRQR